MRLDGRLNPTVISVIQIAIAISSFCGSDEVEDENYFDFLLGIECVQDIRTPQISQLLLARHANLHLALKNIVTTLRRVHGVRLTVAACQQELMG